MKLGSKIQGKYLNLFMFVVKNSGYTQKFRKENLDSCLKGHKKMEEDDMNEVKTMYRSRYWNQEERQKEKSMKKSNR